MSEPGSLSLWNGGPFLLLAPSGTCSLPQYGRGSSYFPEIRSSDCHKRQQKWTGHHLEKGAPHWVSSSEMFTHLL